MGVFKKHKILVVAKVEGETPESYIKKIDENLCLWNDIGNIEAHYPFEATYLRLPEKPLDGFVFSTLDDYSGINLVKDWADSDFADLVRVYATRHDIDIWNDELQDVEHIKQAITSVTGRKFEEYGRSKLPNRTEEETLEEYKHLRTIFCWECQQYAKMSYRMISRLIPGLSPARVCRFLKKDFNINDEKSNYFVLMPNKDFARRSSDIHKELMKIVRKDCEE